MADPLNITNNGPEEEVSSILQEFESILEIMPDDRSALEAVVLAAEAVGEWEKATTYRLRLMDLLAQEGDVESLQQHLDVLREQGDARAESWLSASALGKEDAVPGSVGMVPDAAASGKKAAPEVRSHFNINDEIELAWRLLESKELSQDEYAGLVRDLTDMSASKTGGTVSVLHAMEAARHKNLERILAFLAQSMRTPYVAMDGFAMTAELEHLLPRPFMINRGALVFEVMCRECLVAVLNPVSHGLRNDIQTLTGRRCHFYLTRAAEFDHALVRMKEAATIV